MMNELQQGLDKQERAFLLSLVRNKPDRSQLKIAHLAELPAIRWKLQNLEQLAKANPQKHEEQAIALDCAFAARNS